MTPICFLGPNSAPLNNCCEVCEGDIRMCSTFGQEEPALLWKTLWNGTKTGGAHHDVCCLEMWTLKPPDPELCPKNLMADTVEKDDCSVITQSGSVWHALSRLDQHRLHNWVSFNLTDEWISAEAAVDTPHRDHVEGACTKTNHSFQRGRV